MKERFVSGIFDEAPESWGLRGDPYFWEDLKRHFADDKLPYAASDFICRFERFFEERTGEHLSKESRPYVAGYAHGGMSSGMVCGAFWAEQGLPLLLARLEEANARYGSDSGRAG